LGETSVFVSYRRADTKHAAGRLGERLHERFHLFMDIDSIRPGADFTAAVRNAVDRADVVLALIGTQWLAAADETGDRRIDDPGDWVALEVGTALQRGTPVIPILVDGARMPERAELPPSLADLASRQAISLTHESFAADCTRLIETIEGLVGAQESPDVDLWADPDYPAARSALLQGQWSRAADGLERVLRRLPRNEQVLEQLDQARRRQSLVDLDQRARAAAVDGRWGVAVEALEGMQALEPSDEVAERLAEARRQLKVRSLQHDVRALAARGDWAAVIAADRELAALDPAATDFEGLSTRARQELRAARLDADYRRGVRQLDAGQWEDGEATFAALLALQPGFRDSEELLEVARRRGAPAEPERAEEAPDTAPIAVVVSAPPEPVAQEGPDPAPVAPPRPAPAAPPVEPPARETDVRSSRRFSPLAWLGTAVAAVVLVATVVTGVVLATRDHPERRADTPQPGASEGPTSAGPTSVASTSGPPAATGDELVAAPALSIAPPNGTVAMAGRTAGVQIDGLADVTELGTGDAARSAPPGGRLRAFHLASWTCDVDKCRGWSTLDLKVVVDGDSRPLPDKGGGYVVAIPAGATNVDLVMRTDGYRQSLSLLTGTPGRDNLAVLTRKDRFADIDATTRLTETADPAAQYADGVRRPTAVRDVLVKTARLGFFVDSLRPDSVHQAFLVVDVTYLRPYPGETRHTLKAYDISFRADDGTIYQDIGAQNDVEKRLRIFEVPATTAGGTLLLGSSPRKVDGDNGYSYTHSLSSKEVPFRFS